MFESSSLLDVAFLVSKGFPTLASKTRGSLAVFVVDIREQEAERLLRTPERKMCEEFARAWRDLRKEMDRTLGRGRR
jgi:hypothetical protein